MLGNTLPVTFRAFWLPKRGHSDDEYEDAFAARPGEGLFAIADGATESSYAGLWARFLVEDFVHAPLPPFRPWTAWLPPLQERWAAEVDGGSRPWYVEAKLLEGAFATFLGLVLDQTHWLGRRRWRAVAVGDSCLFQVRQGHLRRTFPVVHSAEFGNTPCLVGSRASACRLPAYQPVHAHGTWRPRDQFWLTTDALAQWMLRQAEAGNRPHDALEQVVAACNEEFVAWIEELRSKEELRNDDVTLLVIGL